MPKGVYKNRELSSARNSLSKKGNQNAKKDNPSKVATHRWIERLLGKPDYCELCKRTTPPDWLKPYFSKGKECKNSYFDWSCKSHTYQRDISDWWRLCKKCHSDYDQKRFHNKKGNNRRRTLKTN